MLIVQAGQLSAAIGVFDEVIANVSSRTKLGGEASLQRAICLDSLVSSGRISHGYKKFLDPLSHSSSMDSWYIASRRMLPSKMKLGSDFKWVPFVLQRVFAGVKVWITHSFF